MKKSFRLTVLTLVLVSIGSTTPAKAPINNAFASQVEVAPIITPAPIVTPKPTPVATPTPTPIIVIEDTPQPLYYDVPLSDELQDFIFAQCDEYELDRGLVVALIWQESTYDSTIVSVTNDYGLMQINKCNHEWLKENMGLVDMLDPYENIQAGCYILSQGFASADGDAHKALMVYNMGLTGAKRHWAQGTTSSVYSRAVMDKYSKIKELYR